MEKAINRCLLDSSFVIDLVNEIVERTNGPARDWLERNTQVQLWISPVTLAEVLEGAEDPAALKSYLGRFSWQGIHRVHAEKTALRQRKAARRLGENDAWQVAIAEVMGARIVGHDAAFSRLGELYDDHRRSPAQR